MEVVVSILIRRNIGGRGEKGKGGERGWEGGLMIECQNSFGGVIQKGRGGSNLSYLERIVQMMGETGRTKEKGGGRRPQTRERGSPLLNTLENARRNGRKAPMGDSLK